MNLTEILFAIAESNPNCKRFRFETVTHPVLTKKNRTTKEPTNFTVEVRSQFIASLGVNYENEVNNLREAQGLARDFEAQKPTGKHYVRGTNWLMEADNTPGKFYAALSRFEGRITTYFINGVPATPEQLEDLRINYLPKPGKPSLVQWRTYSIEGIVSAVPLS
jgi:hypothetical protein